MKLRILQLTVLLAGCLGLFFICYPDCLSGFSSGGECEKLHFRNVETSQQIPIPVKIDSIQNISLRDTSLTI